MPKQQSFEEFFYGIGYKSVGEAITECNKLFKRNIILPTRIPAVEFTHQFGRCSNLESRQNDEFEIEYLNQNTNEKRYRIAVRPSKHKLQVEQHYRIEETYTLKDKTKAVLLRLREFEILVFEKNGLQYRLGLDGRGLHTSPSEVLVQIANTIK
ncbi:hypothetical protein ACFQDF_11610 [Ectobacillus funiculus]